MKATNLNSDRMLVSIRDAQTITGLGRTKVYELLADQTLKSVKVGKRNLVVYQSISDWIARLSRQQHSG